MSQNHKNGHTTQTFNVKTLKAPGSSLCQHNEVEYYLIYVVLYVYYIRRFNSNYVKIFI